MLTVSTNDLLHAIIYIQCELNIFLIFQLILRPKSHRPYFGNLQVGGNKFKRFYILKNLLDKIQGKNYRSGNK